MLTLLREYNMSNLPHLHDTKPMSLLSFVLSIIALFVVSALLFVPLSEEVRKTLVGIDIIICSIFILQWFMDFFRSSGKVNFIKHRWLDMVASLPMIESLRYARIFSILRVILVIRSGHSVIKQLSQNKHETTLASILLLMVILLTVGSSMMMFIEQQSPAANIKDGGDALWWALVTISTVGYGDHYPVTTAGKLLAASLIICGVGLFGMISGLITSMIVAPRPTDYMTSKQSEKLLNEVLTQQKIMLSKLEKLEEKMN